jgi:hypothetical protein
VENRHGDLAVREVLSLTPVLIAAHALFLGLAVWWLKAQIRQWKINAVESDQTLPSAAPTESPHPPISDEPEFAIPQSSPTTPELASESIPETVESTEDVRLVPQLAVGEISEQKVEPSANTIDHESARSAMDTRIEPEMAFRDASAKWTDQEWANYDRSQKTASDELKSDRRQFRRCPFQKEQLVAAYDGNNFPTPGKFKSVLCHDISSSGISFYLDTLPQFQLVVVALGIGAETRYMSAEVKRTIPVERDGKPAILVGCSFTGCCVAEG